MSTNSRSGFLMRILTSNRPKKVVSENERLVMDDQGNVWINYDNPEVRTGVQNQIRALSKIKLDSQKA